MTSDNLTAPPLHHTLREPCDNLYAYFDAPSGAPVHFLLGAAITSDQFLGTIAGASANRLADKSDAVIKFRRYKSPPVSADAPQAADHSLDDALEAGRKCGVSYVLHAGRWYMYRGSYNGRASWLPVSEVEEYKEPDYGEDA